MNNVDPTQNSNLGLNWKQKTSQDYFLFLITVFVALCASLCLWHFSWVWSVQHDAQNIDLCICFETRWERGFAMILRSWYERKIHNMKREHSNERMLHIYKTQDIFYFQYTIFLQLAALKELLQYMYIPIKKLLRSSQIDDQLQL